MKISILLPYKENFSPLYPGAISIFLNGIILKSKYKCEIGFSDHSNNDEIAKLAFSLGATIFEKHIALENQKIGFDIKFSLKGKQIQNFKDKLLVVKRLIGEQKFLRKRSELENLKFRIIIK